VNAPVPIIRADGEGDKQSFLGGGLHTWKLLADDTDGAFFLFEDALSRGKSTPLHRHPDADETVYVLEGEIVVNVDSNESRVAKGGLSFVPRGVAHAFVVVSDRARLLTLKTPGIGQEFYRGASEPATNDSVDKVDIARVQASAKQHGGIELLGPPPFDTASAG
jgi:quercetin dioxygenase-like cupin family protein